MGVHILISGRVQGVGYRAWLKAAAEAQGVSGWTRNLADGRVEAVLLGDDDLAKRVIALARQGPPHSRVDAIEERPAHADECSQVSDGFRILPTV